jgi:flagellar motor protein MotB
VADLAPDAGQSGERHLSTEQAPTLWATDPELVETEVSDQIEERPVAAQEVETIKLTDVVPPIRFASGEADISSDVVEILRTRLIEMQDLQNVRLHLVGHADDQVLSPELSARFGDNEGLSRERAGEVAEFLQRALMLPPESISFSWAGDTMPIASNATEQGRALNRRVEVEIWYDEPRAGQGVEEVVIPRDVKRVKVCRTETVCKLRYRIGHERRARLRNLIPPLEDRDERVALPERFVSQVRQTLDDLKDRQNVVVRVVAHTDDVPLEGRAKRIYGNHLALSKARARRAALQLMDALDLPGSAVDSDGRGASRPVASNATARGRAVNRRIEVEFWYDDALLELPDEPQICPGEADAETVTRVHEPTEGRLPPLAIVDGEAVVPGDFGERLLRGLEEVADRDRPRLRFVGYTRNEGLTRRVAEAYGDDIGLSAARARRTMERLQLQLDLSAEQVEHEGRGFVHAEDVVNGGFLQGETDHVIVQVVYDELAVVDDRDGVEVVPITRELTPQEPLSLNPMRITVDGVPIDDPRRSSADIQRCTDVALEDADVAFRFDDLEGERRLSVSSTPPATSGEPVRFRMYNNYPHFIERAEVRIFEEGQSLRDEPLAVVETDRRGFAEWMPGADPARSSMKHMAFVLRVYGEDGSWDETAPQSLWLVGEDERGALLPENEASGAGDTALLAGYGESERFARNIPIDTASAVRVSGDGIPPGHTVWLAGTELPTNEEGRFVGEVLLPPGLHTVEVAVLDEEGNGELFLRDLELERNDWFFVGMADLTLATDLSGSLPNELSGNNSTDYDALASGRLAFFTNGRWGRDWKLTASADTREGPVEDLFSNFLDKSPQSLFRRLDPDYHLPTFGDDSSIEEMAPTLGKFYVKLEKGDDHLLWGNFTVRYDDNELALVERGLYGANVRHQSTDTTSFGERRLLFDAFAADPGTVPSREEFRGTGGSVYFLNRQDLLIGSERLRVEVRDKATGLVREVKRLQPELDYDIDYIQGRVLLSEPLSAIASDELLVRNDGLSGDEVWLVVQYEYTPGFDEVDVLNAGARAHYWLGDFAKLGVTANRNEASEDDSSLYAADLTLRHSTNSWLKLQASRSEGRVSTSLQSNDGGFDFVPSLDSALDVDDAYGYRADVSVEFSEWLDSVRGRLTVYGQRLEAGYSAPGLNTVTDTDQIGGTLSLPVGEDVEIRAKADHTDQDQGLVTTMAEVNVSVQVAKDWDVQAGARHETRDDDSLVPAATQEEGDRTDAVLQVGYEPSARFRTYAFGQGTVQSTGDRDDNHRGGVGGRYRLNDRLALDGEVSHGDLGPAARAGTDYQHSERTQLYMNYALDNERGYDGLHEQRGTLTTGAKSRLSDSASVYAENQYQHSTVTGLTRAMGVDYVPFEHWTIGLSWEDGETRNRDTAAETTRRAGGIRAGYGTKALSFSSGVEYIYNDTEQFDGSKSHRSTWLFRNNLKYQMNEDGRLLAKFNHAISDSSGGDFFDGGFTEAVLGYAYRPVAHDRLYSLVKYTYFYNMPTSDQVGQNGSSAQFLQKSHIASIDASYELTDAWTIGAKYAYRLSQVSLDREDPDYFDNDAHLAILRLDWRFQELWEATVEGRLLELPDLDERRAGSLVALYRYFGDHLKAGVGYNFTDFSEDLTDLSYDHHGLFFNIVGSF